MKTMSATARSRRGMTLIDSLFATMIVAVVAGGSLTAIQWSRLQSRNLSLDVMAQNMAVSLTEMVKRSGYGEIEYGASLPDLLVTSDTSPILNFPAGENPPEDPTLPAGAAGGATSSTAYDTPSNRSIPSAVSSNTNYLALSNDQIAALNGYASYSAAQSAGASLLNPGLLWGIFIEKQIDPDTGAEMVESDADGKHPTKLWSSS
jgi:type II secretory pathway pseudopilin PulG